MVTCWPSSLLKLLLNLFDTRFFCIITYFIFTSAMYVMVAWLQFPYIVDNFMFISVSRRIKCICVLFITSIKQVVMKIERYFLEPLNESLSYIQRRRVKTTFPIFDNNLSVFFRSWTFEHFYYERISICWIRIPTEVYFLILVSTKTI